MNAQALLDNLRQRNALLRAAPARRRPRARPLAQQQAQPRGTQVAPAQVQRTLQPEVAQQAQRRIAGVSLQSANVNQPLQIARATASKLAIVSTLPLVLRECSIVQQILAIPCSVRLSQRRYNVVTTVHRETMTGSDGSHATLTYSLINSIMTRLIRDNGNACVGGSIEILIYGNPDAPPQQQIVIPEASSFDVSLNNTLCREPAAASSVLSYISVGLQWTNNPNVRTKAQRLGQEFVCGSNECQTGHAMCVLIDTGNQTIELFDPNGVSTPWYPAVARYITQQFESNIEWSNYTIYDNSNLPRYAFQSGSNLQFCAYFSSLYAAIRVYCRNLDPVTLNYALLELSPQDLRLFLQLWHCFLIDYARRTGLLDATERLQQRFTQVFGLLINLRNNVSPAQKQQLWQQLTDIEDIAFNDIESASRDMQKLYSDLQGLLRG